MPMGKFSAQTLPASTSQVNEGSGFPYFRAADRPSGKDRYAQRYGADGEVLCHFAFRNALPQSLSGSIETVRNLATPQTEYGNCRSQRHARWNSLKHFRDCYRIPIRGRHG